MTKVAVKEETAVATAGDNMYLNDTGAGFEEAGTESFAIPFLSVLQSGSPQVKKSDGAYIKGAEEGMLYNSVTNEVYSGEDGIEVIPCYYTQRFIEWKLREAGGGFVGEHQPNDPIVGQTVRDEKFRNITPGGNQLVDTRNHYVLIRSNGSLQPAIMSLASSQLKKSKQLMSLLQGVKVKNPHTGMFEIAPMYSNILKVQTAAESNDKGSWFGYKFSLAGKVQDEGEYAEAKGFAHAIKSGVAKVERKSEEAASSTAY